MRRPSSTAATIVEKSSSARIMSEASLLTSVPVMPMATPMSARRSAGASLTPSPVMATTAPRRAPGVDDAQLLLGVRARVDAHVLDARGERRRRRAPRARSPVIDLTPVAEDAQALRDRGRRELVVAGDHDRADAGRAALRDGGGSSLARRVGQRHDAHEAQVALDRRRARPGRRQRRRRRARAPGSRPRRSPRPPCGRPARRLAWSVARSGAMDSRAPLTATQRASPTSGSRPSPGAWTVVMRRRSASKLTSASRGICVRRSAWRTPSLPAKDTSAPSVGSPVMDHVVEPSAGRTRLASLQAAATRAARRASSSPSGEGSTRSLRARSRHPPRGTRPRASRAAPRACGSRSACPSCRCR